MEEILKSIASPAWWFTAIIAGVFASLTASYSKPLLDKFGSRVSQKYKARVSAKKAKDEALIQKLKSCKDEQILVMLSVNHHRLRSLGFLILGAISMIAFTFLSGIGIDYSSYYVLLIFGSLSTILILFSLADIISAQKLHTTLDNARAEQNT
ncbi:hypothetical protein VXI18_004488 [Vibrio parahaemolyticus]|nr:hypothetical protein [Vibrio parahaemolyticus]